MIDVLLWILAHLLDLASRVLSLWVAWMLIVLVDPRGAERVTSKLSAQARREAERKASRK